MNLNVHKTAPVAKTAAATPTLDTAQYLDMLTNTNITLKHVATDIDLLDSTVLSYRKEQWANMVAELQRFTTLYRDTADRTQTRLVVETEKFLGTYRDVYSQVTENATRTHKNYTMRL